MVKIPKTYLKSESILILIEKHQPIKEGDLIGLIKSTHPITERAVEAHLRRMEKRLIITHNKENLIVLFNPFVILFLSVMKADKDDVTKAFMKLLETYHNLLEEYAPKVSIKIKKLVMRGYTEALTANMEVRK